MNKREIGTKYETCAWEFLESQGFEIIERNFRSKCGEIDIIAKEGEYLCFVEVKYRASRGCGYPEEAVDPKKQRIITKVAMYYLYSHGKSEWSPCRFDVVSIQGEQIQLYRNAFEACI